MPAKQNSVKENFTQAPCSFPFCALHALCMQQPAAKACPDSRKAFAKLVDTIELCTLYRQLLAAGSTIITILQATDLSIATRLC